MVDVITGTAPNQETGGKLTLEEDYKMGKESGVFVYKENKIRDSKEKNIQPPKNLGKEIVKAVVGKNKKDGDPKGELDVPPTPTLRPPKVTEQTDVVKPKLRPVEVKPIEQKEKPDDIAFVEDTEGVTKSIIRGPTKYDDSANRGFIGKGNLPRGITTDPEKSETGEGAGRDYLFDDEFKESAKKDLDTQKLDVTRDDVIDSVTSGNIFKELNKGERRRLKFAVNVLTEPTATSGDRKRANKIIDRSVITVNELRQQDDKVRFAFGRDMTFSPTEEAVEKFEQGDDTLYNKQERYFNSRKGFLKVVRGINFNLPKKQQTILEQVLIDNVTTGEFWDTLTESLNEDARSLSIVLPNLLYNLVGYVVPATVEKMFGDKTFSEAWAESAEPRAKAAQTWRKVISNVAGVDALSEVINDTVHAALKIKFDTGQISEDTYRAMTQSDIRGPDGEFLKKQLVGENQAQAFLMESIDQLGALDQLLMIAATTATGYNLLALKNFGGGSIKSKKSLKALRTQISEAEGDDIIKAIAQGKGKYKDMSTLERAEALRLNGFNIEFNHKLVGQAIREEQVGETFKRMVDERDILKKKMLSMESRKNFNKNSPEYLKVKGDYESLKGKVFRNFWYGRTQPIFREATFTALPAIIMQWGATQIFSPSLDFYTAQGAGALFHIVTSKKFGGGQQKRLTGAGGTSIQDVVANVVKYPFVQMKEATSSYMDIVGLSRIPGVDILRSKDLEEFNKMVYQARGYRLNRKERIAAKYIMDLSAVLPEGRLRTMLSSIKKQVELEESIIAQFPKAEQAEIRKIITAPFAQASGLVWLKSAYAMAGSTGINVKELKDFQKLETLQNIADAQKEQLAFTERALLNLKKLQGRDIENPELLEQFVNKYEAMYTAQKADLIKDATALDDDFQKLNAAVFLDPDVNISPKLADQMLNAGVRSKMDLNPMLSEGEALQAQVAENYALLQKRSEIIKSNLRSGNTIKRTGTLTEETFDLQLQNMIATGRLPYKALDELAKKQGKTIDVSDLLRNLYKKSTEISKTPFRAFFSKDGKFFNSPLNRKLQVSLENMAKRYLKQLPEGTPEKLLEMATTPGSKHFIGDKGDINFFDVALYWQEKKKNFKAFNALPSEVTELYTAFRDYSFRSKKTDPSMAEKIADTAYDIEALVRRDAKDFFTQWKAANANYQKHVFDRLDGDGPLSDFVNSKSDRVTQITKAGKEETKFKNLYKEGKEPDKLFNGFMTSITKYMKTGSDDDMVSIQNYFGNFNRQLSEIVDDQYVFDMTTELGRSKFYTFKNMIEANLYSKWAKGIIDKAEKIDPRVGAQLKKDTGGYNFGELDLKRLDEISEAVQVKIKTPMGIVPANLFDLKKIISDQKDIVKIMKTNKKIKEQYDVFAKTGNAKIKAVAKAELASKNALDLTLDKISRITGMTGEGFYLNYIQNGTVDGLKKLRNDAIEKGMTKEQFDEGVTYLMTQGLFSRGKKVTIPDTFIELPNGAKVAARGFENPENMVGDLNNKNIKAIFNEFLEIDHTEYLTNFTDLLAKEKASMLNLQSITGVVRPIGDNEVISRAFNLARGMVSPTYVGAEFALRIAAGAGIDMIKLAAGNKEASRLMAKMLEFPEKLNKVEISRMSIMIQDFVITELAQMGATIPERFFEYMMEDD